MIFEQAQGLLQAQIHARVAARRIVIGCLERSGQAAAILGAADLLQQAHGADAGGGAVETQNGDAVVGVGEMDQEAGGAVAQLVWVAGFVEADAFTGRVGWLSLLPGPAGGHAAGVIENDDNVNWGSPGRGLA